MDNIVKSFNKKHCLQLLLVQGNQVLGPFILHKTVSITFFTHHCTRNLLIFIGDSVFPLYVLSFIHGLFEENLCLTHLQTFFSFKICFSEHITPSSVNFLSIAHLSHRKKKKKRMIAGLYLSLEHCDFPQF